MKRFIYTLLSVFLCMTVADAQTDKKEVRSGNRFFRKDNYKEADISYRKALVKDSLSIAANYNLANTLYRNGNYDEAKKTADKVKDMAVATPYGADYFFNAGDIALAQKDYGAAVEAFMKSLIINPQDLEAKENYIYAKKMLDDQQKNGGGQNDQDNQDSQDQNQNNQDQGDDQQDKNDRNQDQQDQNNGRNQQSGQGKQQEVKISPQQAQQLLKAIQAKEKETQEKVNKEKAEGLKSRQKEKNW